jgi:chromosome segregation ATPase
VSEEIFYQNQLQDLEDKKTAYFRQLDEIERLRAEIAQKKESINSAGSLISDDYEKICEAKKLISEEYENLLVQNDQLDAAKNEFEIKRTSFSAKESDLKSCIEKFEIELKSFEDRKAKHDTKAELLNKDEEKYREKEIKLSTSEERFNKKIKELVFLKQEIKSHEVDNEVEVEKIERIREYNKLLREKLLLEENKLKSREHELEELRKSTEKAIGTQMNLQRQNLNIKKLNARVEQQFSYIKTLEDNVLELKLKLERANKTLEEVTVCSRIFEQNLELLQIIR